MNYDENPRPSFDSVLSKKELEICDLIAKGHSSEQIAKLLFLSVGTVKNYTSFIFEKTGVANRAQLAAKYIAEYARAATEVPDASKLDSLYSDTEQPIASLRLVGDKSLPKIIPIIFSGQTFTIGRFDITVGRKQFDFEFNQSTKAVSRCHAVIRLLESGCAIEDLNSRAGTYVNGIRLAPESQHLLKNGDKVSFGIAGADYVFEE